MLAPEVNFVHATAFAMVPTSVHQMDLMMHQPNWKLPHDQTVATLALHGLPLASCLHHLEGTFHRHVHVRLCDCLHCLIRLLNSVFWQWYRHLQRDWIRCRQPRR
jgi:hypothetical protein